MLDLFMGDYKGRAEVFKKSEEGDLSTKIMIILLLLIGLGGPGCLILQQIERRDQTVLLDDHLQLAQLRIANRSM